eukprot:TRINITY_DN36577_c0_g1_i1.p1 TRINITY_DN36577_c0_g1~~TRINITY_DN36577_c0_g1_i1.p1  ORF type:complete len:217 (+),score=40.97 TRINITY_DN36577_c0_g1_i1:41-691(+)
MLTFATVGVIGASGWLVAYCLKNRGLQNSLRITECALSEEERDIIVKEMLPGVEQVGTRQLKWYGMRWVSGEGSISESDPIPAASAAVIQGIADKVGVTRFNVATIHRYQRKYSKKGTGSLKDRLVAITPHVDDIRLAGRSGAVTMVQLSGSCDLFLLNKSGTHKVLKTIQRKELMAVTLMKKGFTDMRHALAWQEPSPSETPDEEEMITLTLRWL